MSRIGSTECFLVGPPAQKPLSALLPSNTGLVFCFVMFLCSFSFWSDLDLWRCTVLLRFAWSPAWPPPPHTHTHKGAAADWEQCPRNGHLKTGLKPAMAKLETGARADILKLLSFPLRAEGPRKRNCWLQWPSVFCCFFFLIVKGNVYFSH